jgi:pyruvate formate lyase activating enzyme
MLIKGFQKLSMIDYPGLTSSVIFFFGCNFRCHFCHNPELLEEAKSAELGLKTYTEEEILNYLEENLGFIDGVVITGGEPTINLGLPEFIRKVYELGLKVKLDTNGTNPEMLQFLYEKKWIDFVAMDIKSCFENYEKTVNAKVDLDLIKKSIDLVKKFPKYEFRITIAPGITKDDITKIGEYLKSVGANKVLAIQQFRPDKCYNLEFQEYSKTSDNILDEFVNIAKQYFDSVILRKE